MLFIGIDPGAKGAIAVVDDFGQPFEDWCLCHAKSTPQEQFKYLLSLLTQAQSGGIFALIEKVHAMPKQGVSSTFKFGYSAGLSEGLLVAAQIPYCFVRPPEWQKALGIVRQKEWTNSQKKNSHKKMIQQLWPKIKGVTHDNADALLIAEHCRRLNKAIQV